MEKFKKIFFLTSTCIISGMVQNVKAETEVEVLTKKVLDLEKLVYKLSAQNNSLEHPKTNQLNNMNLKSNINLAEKNNEDKLNVNNNLLNNSDIKIKIYGNLRLDASYDFKGATNTIGNRTGVVPLDKENRTEDALNVSVATSRVGIDIYKPTNLGILTAKLETDFWGDGTANSDGKLRIRHAYGSLGKWLIGQTTSPFVNTDTSPELIDFTGPMGGGTQRNVQVRFTQPLKNNQLILLALEGGDIDNFNGKTQVTGGSRLPALTFRYDRKFLNEKGLMQIHGMLHENRVSTNQKNYEEQLGWGGGIGLKYHLENNDLIMANYYHMVGDSRYLLYANQNNFAYSSTEKIDSNGNIFGYEITPNKYDTLQIGYQRNWTNSLKSNFSVAGIQFKDDSNYSINNKNNNEVLYNVVSNLIYTPLTNLNLGVEYTYGKRKNFLGEEGTISRLNFMTRYSF